MSRRFRVRQTPAQMRSAAERITVEAAERHPGVPLECFAWQVLSSRSQDPRFFFTNAQLAATALGLQNGIDRVRAERSQE